MAGDLAAFGAKLGRIVDGSSTERVLAKAGAAGKLAALAAARDDLGGDMAMSGLRRGRARLGVGYDAVGAGRVSLVFRGPWKLAEEGRRGTKQIAPKRGRAVMTPSGPRAWSTSTPSRGLGTFGDAVDKAKRDIPIAARKQVVAEIRSALA